MKKYRTLSIAFGGLLLLSCAAMSAQAQVMRKKNVPVPVERTAPPAGNDRGIIIVGGKGKEMIKAADTPAGGFEVRDEVPPPKITPNPNPVPFTVYIPKGQTERTVDISWDDGPTYQYCEIFLSINDAAENELGRGEQGTKPVTIALGAKYAFRMVVYSDDQGGNPTTVANLILTGQPKPDNPPGGGGGGASAGMFKVAPGRAAMDAAVAFFRDVNVHVERLRDAITFSFETIEPTEVFIEVSKQRPDRNAPVRVHPGQKLGAAFPAGAELAAFTLPGLSGVNTKHRATLRRAGGEVLEADVTYHYVITAKAPDGSFWRYGDKFTTGVHTVKVIFEKIKIINDSDPDVVFEDCGEIKLWFRVNAGQPSAKDIVLGSVNDDNACTGKEYDINKELLIENAPNTLTLSVVGMDSDSNFPTPFIEGDENIRGPRDQGYAELNVAAGEFDLTLIEAGTSKRISLRSVPAESSRQGDLMFEVYVRVGVTYPKP